MKKIGFPIGSPPRMRGKRLHEIRRVVRHEITPAHAGKTAYRTEIYILHWDHPRACGENFFTPLVGLDKPGSPPRMRGKPSVSLSIDIVSRITPAHAGKTRSVTSHAVGTRDHPRACGENRIGSHLYVV